MNVEKFVKLAITESEKNYFIDSLTNELIMLRTKADVSQEELSSIVGVSRQTYGAIERKTRRMSWSTYLALIMFYDYNQKTHKILRTVGIFPYEIFRKFNDGKGEENLDAVAFLGEGSRSIVNRLDEHAMHSIRSVIMLEYARCTQTPGEMVIKAFDGLNFTSQASFEEE